MCVRVCMDALVWLQTGGLRGFLLQWFASGSVWSLIGTWHSGEECVNEIIGLCCPVLSFTN